MRRCIPLALLVFLPLGSGQAGASQGVEEIEACLRANMPERTSVQTVTLRSVDRSGGERTLEGRIYWKRSAEGFSRTLIEVQAPPTDRGSAYLWLEHKERQETFVYLPELKKARRIHPRTASGSLFGTDFSYEDIQHLQKLSSESGTAERLPDSTLDGRAVAVVRATPSPETSSTYRSIVYFVDQQSCVPLKIEFYEAGGDLRKVLRSDPGSLSQEGKGWIARSVSIRDLAQGTGSHLRVEKIEMDAKVPDRLFSVQRLERRRH